MLDDLVLNIINNNGVDVTDSRDIAKMVGKSHNTLLRDIRIYINELDNSQKTDDTEVYSQDKIEPEVIVSDEDDTEVYSRNYFIGSTYTNSQNKIQPCFLVTQKGCEYIAHKMKGKKAAKFTAKYIEAFHDMKDALEEVETTVQTNGLLTEKEWNNIKKKSKYLTKNIHSGKSTRDYIKGCDLMHLQDVIDEVYDIAKPCRGEIKYEILNNAIKTLKEISSQYDYSNPMNTFIKTVANDGVIKLQSIHTEKLVRGNNNKDRKINDLKSDIEALKPISFDDMIMVNNYAISKNDLNDACIDSVTSKPKICNTNEYKGWKYYFKKAMDEVNIKQLFSHIDWSKPVEISYAVTCHENNDIGNFIDALQDVIQNYFNCDDRKFLVGTQLIVGIEPDKMKRKTWLYFRNVEENNLYVEWS